MASARAMAKDSESISIFLAREGLPSTVGMVAQARGRTWATSRSCSSPATRALRAPKRWPCGRSRRLAARPPPGAPPAPLVPHGLPRHHDVPGAQRLHERATTRPRSARHPTRRGGRENQADITREPCGRPPTSDGRIRPRFGHHRTPCQEAGGPPTRGCSHDCFHDRVRSPKCPCGGDAHVRTVLAVR